MNEDRNEEIMSALLSLAKGCTTKEVVEEYVLDENKTLILKSQKVTTKNLAPDLSAIKMLFSIENNDNYSNLTDEELEQEKERLLKLLSK